MALASITEHGDFIYITSPVQVYGPEQAEMDSFVFAADLRQRAPNPKLLWLKGQYVEADQANRNGDEWSAGELTIKALTPVLCPVTVMHDLRSAVGTIADAKLLTPEHDQVPRARIDTTLAIWEHRFPEIAAEARANAEQGTLMQSMECLSPFFDCSACGAMMRRGPNWEKEWRAHAAEHTIAATSSDRSPTRNLRNVTFTGVGLIFGTRGARGAMPSAHLEVEELAAMHREAHEGSSTKRARRTNTVDIEDVKYEALVAGKSEAESKVSDLTAKLVEAERKIETLEAAKVTADEALALAKAETETAKEAQRVAAMRDERLASLGAGFRAKLDKLETTAKRVKEQAATFSDEDWTARLEELEESLAVKRDAALDPATPAPEKDTLAGTLFTAKDIQTSALTAATNGSTEVTAAADTEPSAARRQSVIGGLVRKKREPAKA